MEEKDKNIGLYVKWNNKPELGIGQIQGKMGEYYYVRYGILKTFNREIKDFKYEINKWGILYKIKQRYLTVLCEEEQHAILKDIIKRGAEIVKEENKKIKEENKDVTENLEHPKNEV